MKYHPVAFCLVHTRFSKLQMGSSASDSLSMQTTVVIWVLLFVDTWASLHMRVTPPQLLPNSILIIYAQGTFWKSFWTVLNECIFKAVQYFWNGDVHCLLLLYCCAVYLFLISCNNMYLAKFFLILNLKWYILLDLDVFISLYCISPMVSLCTKI